jgi:hypothetical protein
MTMGKAKIGFEVDEVALANAKAYVARHGGSLNKLVSALFASLGQEERERVPAIDPSTSILMAVSSGKISVMEAARRLELRDAGYVFHRLAEKGIPLPRLSDDVVKSQLDEARFALDDCLLEPSDKVGRKRGQGRERKAAA